MKKVLALVLAVMMMAAMGTMAFALDVGGGSDTTPGEANANPGDTIRFYIGAFAADKEGKTPLNGTLTSEYFTIAAKTWSKGGALVKEVKLNDDKECVEVVLKENYTLETPAEDAYNLVSKALEIKCKKDTGTETGAAKKRGTYGLMKELADAPVGSYLIGWDPETIDITKEDQELVAGTINKIKGSDKVAYETVSATVADIAYMEGRVYDGDKFFFDADTDINTDIVKKYPDAELDFVNLKNSPSFNSNFDLEVYGDEDSYIYEVKDGKLVASSLKWDDDAYAFVGRVRTLGSYVISDTKLPVSAAADTGNPDTGANDVVGIATALAAVALVSAAAVSLKK